MEAYRGHLSFPDEPPLFRHLLVGAESLCLAQMGQPGRVLDILLDAESPPCHFVCYGLLRANAYIAMENPVKALESTALCAAMGSSHSTPSRASMLVREAVAHEMLGVQGDADRAFTRASRIAVREGLAVPPVGLPLPTLETLADRMAAQTPQVSVEVEESPLPTYPRLDAPSVGSHAAALSSRELVLARHLAYGRTFAQIAEESFLSVNTLKTQASSLYRKLGVKTRADAVALMKQAGFFV